ncbi:MAG: ribosomal protein L7/L12 [Pseudomonadota bacterium]
MESTKVSEKVLMHIRAGRKIAAIKTLREEQGFGLKMAKDMVDHLSRSLREANVVEEERPLAMGEGGKPPVKRQRRKQPAPDSNHAGMPDYVVKRRPVLPQIIAFLVFVAFVYSFLNR